MQLCLKCWVLVAHTACAEQLEMGIMDKLCHHCRAKLKGLKHSLTEENIDDLAAAAHGFVGADLAAICNEAAMAALRRHISALKGSVNRPSAAESPSAANRSAGRPAANSAPAVNSHPAADSPTAAKSLSAANSPSASMRIPAAETASPLDGSAQPAGSLASQKAQPNQHDNAATQHTEQVNAAELRVTLADFKVAETRVQPSAMREVGLEVCD